MVATTHDVSFVFIELGLVVVGLAVLARLASRWGFSVIPLYLLAGLAFGNGGLAIFGAVLLVAGLAQRFQVSAAIGAFLVGIALSGSVAEQSHRVISPLRDLFAAIFFFFGLEIDPASLVPALPFAVGLGVVTTLTKMLTGYWAARGSGVDQRGRLRAGMELVARGEFSIV